MNPLTFAFRATVFLSLSSALIAAPPQPLTPAEIAAVQADAATQAPAAAAAHTHARVSLDADLAAAAATSKAATEFIAKAELPAATADPQLAATQALEVKPDATATVVNCEGGVYFDAAEGKLVYLKNVTVKDPRFDLRGANELTIFFGKKPPEPEKKAPAKSQLSAKPDPTSPSFGSKIATNFSEVERIVATGAVKIQIKAVEAKPAIDGNKAIKAREAIEASGAIFTYNPKSDQVILSGGYPWFTQGKTYMRAKQPNLILKLSPETGNFVTQGPWEMGGSLEPKSKPPTTRHP